MPDPAQDRNPDEPAAEKSSPARPPASARVKGAAIALLFSIILVIPRIRRLRRRVWAWTVVRILIFSAGAWCVWLFARPDAKVKWLVLGIVLLAFGILVRSRPELKSVDAVARELGALVVLNGGTFLAPGGAKPIQNVSIFVNPEHLLVLTGGRQQTADIPVAGLRRVRAHCVPSGAGNKSENGGWEIEMTWEAGGLYTAHFRYEGFFAEHLARVAQQTIESVWKKGLPVLK